MTRRARAFALAPLLLAALCGCELARYAAGQRVIVVPTAGMAPTIQPGWRAWVDTGFYERNEVRRFDIVMFQPAPENVPPGDESLYVQRVIALGGESVEIRDGLVYVDGRWLEEPHATEALDRAEKFGPLVVPAGEYFLLGDNRPNSADSRYWPRPTLGKSLIRGKVVEIVGE